VKNKVKTKQVDICVLTIGRYDFLKKCLDSIQAELEHSGVDANVYLLENGTPLGANFTHGVITKRKRISPMKGFPEGANASIRMGHAPLVWFVTDDVVVQPGSLTALLQRMNENPKIGQCGLKLIFPKDSINAQRPAGKVQHVGHGMTIRGDVVHPLVGWEASNPKCNVSRDVFSVTGATFMVRRNVFEGVGGFDLRYGNGTYEDVSLSLQIRRAGYIIFIDTNALAEHYVGGSVTPERSFPLQQNAGIFRMTWQNSGLLTWNDYVFYD
jgi:GT2 family glycosyltransferase